MNVKDFIEKIIYSEKAIKVVYTDGVIFEINNNGDITADNIKIRGEIKK